MAKRQNTNCNSLDDVLKSLADVQRLLLNDIVQRNDQSKGTPLSIADDLLTAAATLIDAAHRLWVPFPID